jgi:hypothetical protein
VFDKAVADFHRDGFVRVTEGVLSQAEFKIVLQALERLEAAGTIDANSSKLQNLNDAIYFDDAIMNLARHPRVLALVEAIVGQKVELQHAKMINKYPAQGASSNVNWHQDYPFFPHTNDDLLAFALHFDDETDESGPLQFLSGSHKTGVLSHADAASGEFVYKINDPSFDMAKFPSTVVKCNAGDVTLHHGNVIHASSPSKGKRRRVLYLQYRAIDALQLAGVIWKSTGFSPYAEPPVKRYARFRDGSTCEVRSDGKLFDLFGKLAPDNKGGRNISE